MDKGWGRVPQPCLSPGIFLTKWEMRDMGKKEKMQKKRRENGEEKRKRKRKEGKMERKRRENGERKEIVNWERQH